VIFAKKYLMVHVGGYTLSKKKQVGLYHRKGLFILTILTTIIYISWRVFFTIPFEEGTVALVLGIGLLIVEFIGMFEAFEHYYNMANVFLPQKQNPPNEWYPHIDVFIATYNESTELLQKTINGCLGMDYPDKQKVHIYVCDDNRRDQIKDLAIQMGVNYIKRVDNTDAKAGNFNHAMSITTSPLIVTLDADMIPLRNFLMTIVPYFYEEEIVKESRKKDPSIPEKKIGFVQSPQSFYNPDLFQFNLYSENRIPDEQDYFYKDVQASRNKSNAVIYGGSNTVLSRQALTDAGGFFTGVITEDFATGIMIQRKGYTCYAISEIVASGLSPADLKSLINQRRRWARGCIQTMKATNFVFKKGWSINQRFCYLSSVLYWYAPIKRLFYIISPIAFSVFSIVVVKCTVQEVLLFWLPMYILQARTLNKLSSNIRNTRWTNVYETILFPSLLPAVILETFGIKNKTFSVTRKDGVKENLRWYQIKHAIPHLLLATLCFIGILNCVRYMFATGSAVYLVIVFWLMSNLYNLLMSAFFIMGRDIKRRAERYHVDLPCQIMYGGKCIKMQTVDVSENGFSFFQKKPCYIPEDQELKGTIENDRYSAFFSCKIAKVIEVKNGYQYAVYITQFDDVKNQLALYSIIYDRCPSLPNSLDDSASLLDDLVINFKKRIPKNEYINRRLPRVYLYKKIDAKECNEIELVNFNFDYFLVHLPNNDTIYEKLTIPLTETMDMRCSLVKDFVENAGEKLYRVDNLEEFVDRQEFNSILDSWGSEYRNKKLLKEKKPKSKGVSSHEFDERKYM
jgi:cellulose synthase (UDP-forming)